MSFVIDVHVHSPIHLHSELEAERPGLKKKQKGEGGCLRVTGMNYFDLTS